MEKIKIRLIRPTSKAPFYATASAAGADIFADVAEKTVVSPHSSVLIPSGFAVEIPAGFAGFVYPRSGISLKKGLAPANKVGVIDSDYRGEVMVSLHNHSDVPSVIEPGERIAQLVIAPVYSPGFETVCELSGTDRGSGGFGSTGEK